MFSMFSCDINQRLLKVVLKITLGLTFVLIGFFNTPWELDFCGLWFHFRFCFSDFSRPQEDGAAYHLSQKVVLQYQEQQEEGGEDPWWQAGFPGIFFTLHSTMIEMTDMS